MVESTGPRERVRSGGTGSHWFWRGSSAHRVTPLTEKDSRTFPSTLTTIDGKEIDVQQLAKEKNLVVVTLKAPWCRVCHRQLLRLKALWPELEPCRVTFVVLAPGPAHELARVRERTGFDFPFVADENLDIARALQLEMGAGQMVPALFHVLPNLKTRLDSTWTQRRILWRRVIEALLRLHSGITLQRYRFAFVRVS